MRVTFVRRNPKDPRLLILASIQLMQHKTLRPRHLSLKAQNQHRLNTQIGRELDPFKHFEILLEAASMSMMKLHWEKCHKEAMSLLSRRSVIRSLSFGSAALTLGGTGFGRSSKRAKAFALCGDESHNSDYIRTALTSNLVDGAGLSIDFTDDERLLTYDNLKHYEILIMFRDGLRFPKGYYQAMYWTGKPEDIVSVPPLEKKIGTFKDGVAWMTAEQGRAIKTWIQGGGSLWAFHNNSQASSMNKDYRDVEGAIYTGHPRIRPYKVHIVNREHPIAKGIKDFVVTDEQHYVTYDKDPKYVIARSVNENGLDYTDQAGRRSNTSESIWAYDYGKGRVCFMAPGHMITVLWNPEYVKMQKNAVDWLLHES